MPWRNFLHFYYSEGHWTSGICEFVFKSNFFKYFAAPLSLSFGVFEFMYIWPFEVVRELNDDLTFYPNSFLSVCFIWMFSIANSPNSLIFFFCKVYLRNFQLRNCSFIYRKSFWIFQSVFNMSLFNVFNISSKILSIWNRVITIFSVS